ncbi:GNAT family N-acetyltransferase [Oceanobacillus bengalensis]|uniref:N-acetyltransferase n=1 Tax=Oceanobacillus bengalensis TaxID=1435466 RepID=A0A494Z3I8_9BACI|nr:GNAT family protein [Oceanobacillus bengalensis]RKQ16864.1 N-acetyltransferase [Oceanobacillus bengalensis]
MIRQAVLTDAAALANVIQQVERESQYMLYEAGERDVSAEKQCNMIKALSGKENSGIFVALEQDMLVGYLLAIGGNTNKNKHSAYIVIGIMQEFTGRGIGAELFKELEAWAEGHIHRLELTVITDNIAGVKLYEKAGFQVEGTKRNSLYMNGRFVDEYYMSKILEG